MSLVFDGGVVSADHPESLGRADLDIAGENFRPVPAQGHDHGGSDADIVIFDPDKTATLGVKTLHMKMTTTRTRAYHAGRERDGHLARQSNDRARPLHQPRRRWHVSEAQRANLTDVTNTK